MTRVSAVIGAILLALLASTAGAVGLGNILLRSALTEPLDAEISISNPGDLETDELSVGLASEADFQRAGVERPIFLQQIDFALRQDGDDLVVDITTDENVDEPFLDFLVELRWPGGRLVREYTLLLDPPTFAPDGAGTGEVFPAEDPFDGEAPEAEPPTPEPIAQPTPATPQTRVEQLPDDQYRVANNDTLWEIALRARTDPSQTPQQIMLAIQDLNPDAFIDGNINRVRAGRLLNLPDAEQVAVRTSAQANQEVQRQNDRFRGVAPPGDTQISATDDTESALAPGAPGRDPDGFLEVITEPDTPDEASAADGDADSETAQLQNELAIQRELNDELRLQSEEQQSRLAELEEQVELLTRLVELQTESASQLQAATEELARQQAEMEAGVAPSEAPDPDAVPESEAPAEPAAPVEESPTLTLDQAMAQAAGLLDRAIRWLSQPYNGGLVLAALVLILLLVNRLLKRRQSEEELESLDVDEDLLDDDGEMESDDLLDDTGLDDGDQEPENPSGSTSVASPAAAAEAIENAELYMAFQRYEEAERTLKAAIEQSPGEPSLQLKLMELYSETGDASAFETIASNFAGDAAAVDNLRRQLGSSHLEDSPDDGTEAQDFVDSFEPDDLSDNDFDDLDLDFNDAGDLVSDGGTASTSPDDNKFSTDFDLSEDETTDFELPELEDALTTPGEEDVKTEDRGVEFDGGAAKQESFGIEERSDDAPWKNDDEDFSVDFAPSSPEETPAAPMAQESDAAADSGEDDLSLDFDLPDLDSDDRVLAADEPSRASDVEDDDVSLSMDQGDDDLELDFDFGDLDADDATGETEFAREDQGDTDLDLGDLGDFDDLKTSAPEPEPAESDALPEDSLGADADDWDEDFDFLDGADEVATKLDLARAYIDMEDPEGAKDILGEVMDEGTDEQKQQAQTLLGKL